MSERPKKSSEKATQGSANADWDVDLGSRGRFPLSYDSDDPATMELLTHWDEMSPDLLEEMAAHPVHGPRLRHLQEAESWLERQAYESGDCPGSHVLYDYGRGPGFVPLEAEHRERLEEHLAICGQCEALVESLVSSPPLPLDFAAPQSSYEPAEEQENNPLFLVEAEESEDRNHLAHLVGPAPTVLRLVPLAAAAILMAVALIMIRQGTTLAGDGSETSALLRGEAGGPLYFPRDSVLAATESTGELGLGARPLFEVEPVEGASEYRVVLSRHDGSAFSEGEEVDRLRSSEPRLEILEDSPALSAGNYTWEAWAIVDGLDQRLGARDFRVVADSELALKIETLLQDGVDAAAPRIVDLLHAAGYTTDARRVARHFLPTEERDEYLLLVPGR